MKSLYLPEWNAFIRYFDIPRDGETIVYLPVLSFPVVVNFLSVATHPKMPKHRAILVDNLGSGFSDHSESFNYSMEGHAKTVANILDHEGIKNATVVGHSMGGTIAIMLALSRPDLVSKLVVAEGNITPGGGEATRSIASYSKTEYVEHIFPKSRKEWFQAAIEGDATGTILSGAWSTASAAGLHGNSKSLVEIDPSVKDQFYELPIPRTFIYGEKSLPENSGEVGADAPEPGKLEAHGIQIGVVPNAGHLQMLENLDGFIAVLTKAIKV
ncbi:MAG: alpha/beta hydrolase [Gammaproteobacteria bacterium]|nr:alpha/beta hydrolase [Gammaproteobacteria bacterium]